MFCSVHYGLRRGIATTATAAGAVSDRERRPRCPLIRPPTGVVLRIADDRLHVSDVRRGSSGLSMLVCLFLSQQGREVWISTRQQGLLAGGQKKVGIVFVRCGNQQWLSIAAAKT